MWWRNNESFNFEIVWEKKINEEIKKEKCGKKRKKDGKKWKKEKLRRLNENFLNQEKNKWRKVRRES